MTQHIQLDPLLDKISGPEMMRHMEEFSRWTKHAGTPEELSSLEYVEDCLRTYGYSTQLLKHDAYISLPGNAQVQALGKDIKCIAHSFSRPSPKYGLSGALVYLGNGSPRDFEQDVKGKIVLIDGIANPAVALRASQAGAIGQMHISPHEYLHEMCISPVWGSPTHKTVENLPKTVVVTIALEEGQELKNALMSGSEEVTVTLVADVDTGWRKTPLLVAELPTTAPSPDEPFVLFTGHHDTWYYGVMDNGGANATMLEVARLCALERASWQRGLRIIFWSGHSQGRYSSSSWYADQAWHELEKRAVAHVNVDSTGGKGNTIVADTTAAAELRQLAREAIESQGQQEFSGRRMQRAGDQSFWGIGVPSIFGNMSEQPAGGEANASAAVFGGNRRLGHGTGWWWHTPYDTLDKIDESILLRDTRIYLFVVWRLLTDEILPLDYAEHTAYLQEELESLQVSIGDHFNLSDLIDKTKALKSAADRFNTYRQPALQSKRVSLFNHCLCQLSRQLVPIDYTEGDRFEQDPALSQQVLPSLQPALGFRNLQPDEDTYKFLTVSMMRARNRVATSLDDALYLLQEANDALEEGGPNAPQYERLGPL